MWHDFEYQVGERFAIWQGVEYDIIGDGTFEYPTLEQQKQIKADIEASRKQCEERIKWEPGVQVYTQTIQLAT